MPCTAFINTTFQDIVPNYLEIMLYEYKGLSIKLQNKSVITEKLNLVVDDIRFCVRHGAVHIISITGHKFNMSITLGSVRKTIDFPVNRCDAINLCSMILFIFEVHLYKLSVSILHGCLVTLATCALELESSYHVLLPNGAICTSRLFLIKIKSCSDFKTLSVDFGSVKNTVIYPV